MTELTVVMPVHNAQPFLSEAIESILAQTFGDFIFVIGDDGSTDGSHECMEKYAKIDRRIKLLRRQQKSGPAQSSNWVANAAQTPLVARMDGDDLAAPNRLEIQMNVMRQFPETVLVGSLFNSIDFQGREVFPRQIWRIINSSTPPIAHPSILYRKKAFDAVGGYSEDANYCEDTDLYARIATQGEILMLPQALCTVRYGGVSARLHVDKAEVENKLNYFRRRAAATKAGLPPVLPDEPKPKRIDPNILFNLALLRVLSGQKAEIFPRILSHGKLALNFKSLKIITYALSLALFPQTLVSLMTAYNHKLNRKVADKVQDDNVYRWNPEGPAKALGAVSGIPPKASSHYPEPNLGA
jgi:glycosyltransferase involved in cell wall biosynthesis